MKNIFKLSLLLTILTSSLQIFSAIEIPRPTWVKSSNPNGTEFIVSDGRNYFEKSFGQLTPSEQRQAQDLTRYKKLSNKQNKLTAAEINEMEGLKENYHAAQKNLRLEERL